MSITPNARQTSDGEKLRSSALTPEDASRPVKEIALNPDPRATDPSSGRFHLRDFGQRDFDYRHDLGQAIGHQRY